MVEPEAQQRQQAFEKYVLPEVDMLVRVAFSLAGQAADAEDLVQDTLIRAYRGVHSFDGAYPRAWLLTILRNTQINRTRRRRPELLHDQDAAFAQLAASETTSETPEAVVAETFDAAVIDALTALPQRYREIVTLVDIDGLSYSEAAGLLGVPMGTIMSRLHRARAKMRQRLAASGVAPRRKQ